jgi:hypothetical protein
MTTSTTPDDVLSRIFASVLGPQAVQVDEDVDCRGQVLLPVSLVCKRWRVSPSHITYALLH